MKCPKCKAEIEEGAVFCTHCGKSLPKRKKCVSCGTELPMDMVFCTNCGTKQPLEEVQGGEVNKQKRKSPLLIVIASIFIIVSLIGGYMIVNSNGTSIDEEKCNSDYIVERVYKTYDIALNQANYGMGNAELLSDEYTSQYLKSYLSKVVTNENINDVENFATGYNMQFETEYNLDMGDPFLGEEEVLIMKAEKSEPVEVHMDFQCKIFYKNGKYEAKHSSVKVLMIYENGDWFVNDIVYENGQTLLGNLNKLINGSI